MKYVFLILIILPVLANAQQKPYCTIKLEDTNFVYHLPVQVSSIGINNLDTVTKNQLAGASGLLVNCEIVINKVYSHTDADVRARVISFTTELLRNGEIIFRHRGNNQFFDEEVTEAISHSKNKDILRLTNIKVGLNQDHDYLHYKLASDPDTLLLFIGHMYVPTKEDTIAWNIMDAIDCNKELNYAFDKYTATDANLLPRRFSYRNPHFENDTLVSMEYTFFDAGKPTYHWRINYNMSTKTYMVEDEITWKMLTIKQWKKRLMKVR